MDSPACVVVTCWCGEAASARVDGVGAEAGQRELLTVGKRNNKKCLYSSGRNNSNLNLVGVQLKYKFVPFNSVHQFLCNV